MIDRQDIEARKAALADLMGQQLRVGGQGLERKLKRAGRLLPGWVRRDAARLVDAGQLAANPKLARQIDVAALDAAQARITRYLEAQDPREKRTTARLHMAGGLAFRLLIVAGLFVWVARWQGLL